MNEPITSERREQHADRMKPRLRPRSRISRRATSQIAAPAAHRATSRRSPVARRATASMNSSEASVARRRTRRTSPAARAPREQRRRGRPRSSTSSLTRSPARSRTVRSRRPSSQAPSGARDLDLEMLAAGRRLERLDRARGDDPAAAMITTSSQTSSTRSSWWLREDDADAGRGALADDLGHRRDADRVEAGERLVEDEQLRVVDERRRQLDPLLVAVRQLLELRLRPVGEAHPLEPAPSPRRWRRWPAARAAGRSS